VKNAKPDVKLSRRNAQQKLVGGFLPNSYLQALELILGLACELEVLSL
jgi:hypothetical protein